MEKPETSVRLRNACKSYGSGQSLKTVLANLNMDVPKGSIYGLLGASGCGKTTILGCIAGRLKLDSGELQVLGGEPGAKGSGIPGPRIGYMPQEPALISEMTITNILYYFGWIFNMSNEEIAERHEFLSTLLDLPTDDRCIKNLSGGQQRRVSLAAALIQTPELLLLDEPTVGLDPVLRQSIWDYMIGMSRDQGITIIITTHYIEEATQAHKIGLLRDGILLADASPQQIMQDYSCDSLEKAFLQLSSLQEDSRTESQIQPTTEAAIQTTTSTPDADTAHNEGSTEVVFNDNEISFNVNKTKTFVRRKSATWRNHIKALLYKDVLTIRRNHTGFLGAFLFPLVALVIFFVVYGHDGFDLPLGIVNDESANCTEIIRADRNFSGAQLYLSGEYYECHYQQLSCVYIHLLEQSTTVRLYHYNDLETALAASRATINQALIYIPSNFSVVMEKRATQMTVDNDTIDKNLILAHVDMSDYIIGYQLKRLIADTFTELSEIVSRECNFDKKAYRTPIKFLEPVYGRLKQSNVGSTMPGILIIMVHVFASIVSSTLISTDRASGIWDRNLLTGATALEMITSLFVSNLILTTMQMAGIFIISFFVFNLECNGSLVSVVVMFLLQSVCGLAFGLFISALATNVMESVFMSQITLLPYSLVSGCLWPFHSAFLGVQIFGYVTPITFSTFGLTSITIKGHGLMHRDVIPGIVMPLSWTIIFYCAASFVLRRK